VRGDTGSRNETKQVSEYRARVINVDDVDVRQLALALVDAMGERRETRPTFGQLADDWLKRLARVCPENERRHVRHMEPLLEMREGELTKAAIEHCFVKLDKERGGHLGPATLNKLRSTGQLIIDDAAANGQWGAANPFRAVGRRRVPKKPWPRVTADELARALAELRPDRQRECIWQIHAGTRPGEMKALRKSDVDLDRGFVTVQRSNARDETKTGKSRVIPIPAGARAALVAAMMASTSALVFPGADGQMQRFDVKLSRTLRTAFKRAGIVTGYRFKCRRKGCGFFDEQPVDDPERCCPKCNFKLWSDGVPKNFTFYGLRHAAATLHREQGADALAVKMALGHATRDASDDVYTHFSDETYRRELAKLVIKPAARTRDDEDPTDS
jgi:integrase